MSEISFQVSGNLVDIHSQRIYPATIHIVEGKIDSIVEIASHQNSYLLPGFIDAHVHVESSMLVPREFARAAVLHGTVATISDPHEIANVLGVEGVRYMLDNADGGPFKFYFGAPACVPATLFETAGAEISSEQVCDLLNDPKIKYLSEVMNFPGVLAGDESLLAKIQAAARRGKPVDGHAPGLRGEEARAYIETGISTDHECFTRAEALDKIAAGAKIQIREGSAARNFDALYTLIDEFPDNCMLCSDDKHPDELLLGHINELTRRAVTSGLNLFSVLRTACVNPVRHYGLDVGLLRIGEDADFIEVNNVEQFEVLRTYIRGQLVADRGKSYIDSRQYAKVNIFHGESFVAEDFACPAPPSGRQMRVIEAIDGQLITKRRIADARVIDGKAVSDPSRDILKLTVVNRYRHAAPAVAFISGFGLRRGGIASSVAHDSHNIIAVGVDDEDICVAVNLVVEAAGGLAVASQDVQEILPLPIAGLMSEESCNHVGAGYAALDQLAKQFGSSLRAPFMTLSFMALLVMPEIKLSDRGLFDGVRFEFIPLFI